MLLRSFDVGQRLSRNLRAASFLKSHQYKATAVKSFTHGIWSLGTGYKRYQKITKEALPLRFYILKNMVFEACILVKLRPRFTGPFEISKCPVDRGQALRCIPAEVQEFHGISIFASVSLWGGSTSCWIMSGTLQFDENFQSVATLWKQKLQTIEFCKDKTNRILVHPTSMVGKSHLGQSQIFPMARRGKYWKETSPFQKQAFKHALMHYSIRVGES